LVVDSALESSWRPFDELDGSLGLDNSDGSSDILWNDVSTIHKAASHVFAVSWIALGQQGSSFEDRVGQLSNSVRVVSRLSLADERSIRAKHKVDSRERNQVSLEFVDINVQRSFKSQRSSDRGDGLSDDTIQVAVGWSFDIELLLAHVVDGFIVQKERNISMFQEGVGREHRVVWLYDGGRDLG
jgi:hypothetical protein